MQLWTKVRKAPGFSPDFPTWMLESDICDFVPLDLPPLEWLQHASDSLKEMARHWNQIVGAQKRRADSTAFLDDWKKGGRLHAVAVKPNNWGTLDAMARSQTLQVRLCRTEKGQPARFRIQDPALVTPGAIWTFGKLKATVVAVSGNIATLDKSASVQMARTSVKQSTMLAEPQFVADEVQKFWDSYWNVSSCPSESTMQRLLVHMPHISTFDASLSADDLRFVIQELPGRKARGLDGWSNGELKLLTNHDLQSLVDIFNSALLARQWPTSLSDAAVTLLSKIQQPMSPKDGRPITVLPTLYRLWGKAMTQKIFSAILPYLPKQLFGSVPGRSAEDAAWELQSQLEEALASNSQLAGVSLDLSKAYNTLPRQFVQRLAIRCGWPPDMVELYLDALNKLRRFFRVHDGLYNPTFSSTGVPEGCPIAVPVMILVTWAFTLFMQSEGAQLLSYVDNWTLLADAAGTISSVLPKMKMATDGLGLLLNPDKTQAFATTAAARSYLRQQTFDGIPLNVVHSTEDLGTNFVSVCKATVNLREQRKLENFQKLERLGFLPWTTSRKTQMILRVIQPSLLYGCAVSPTPQTYITELRRKFLTSVWGKQHHRNHFMAPLFGTETTVEPFLMIFAVRLRCLRRAANMDWRKTQRRWAMARSASKTKGPMSYLFAFLDIIHWSPLDPGIVRMTDGELDLLQMDVGQSPRTLVPVRSFATSG